MSTSEDSLTLDRINVQQQVVSAKQQQQQQQQQHSLLSRVSWGRLVSGTKLIWEGVIIDILCEKSSNTY